MGFRILGPIEVHEETGKARLTGGKTVTLFAAMIFQANRVMSHEQLIAAVWGNDPPGTATTALHTCVSRLRRALAEIEPDGLDRIVTGRNGYLLRVRLDELDLDQFREDVERARSPPPRVG